MKRIIVLVLLVVLSFGSWGCKSRMIKDLKPEEVILPLSESEQLALVVTASFVPLQDKRPKEDIAYMTSVREKVSARIMESLKSIDLFDEINFPANNEDVFMLTGEIRKFGWESYDTMISYIPGLNVLPFFGLPSTRVVSEADVYIELRNTKTEEIIFGFSESYSMSKTYNIYNFKPELAQKELADCFDIVLKRIKDRVLSNTRKVLAAAYAIAIEAVEAKNKAKAEMKVEEKPKEKAPEVVGAEIKVQPESKVEVKPQADAEKKPQVKAEQLSGIEVKPEAAKEAKDMVTPAPAANDKVEDATKAIEAKVENKAAVGIKTE